MLVLSSALSMGACGETPLTVMSFNVRYATAFDGPNSWPHRKDVLAAVIRRCAPDLIGTQECLEPQAEFIAQALPDYRWIGIGREADGKGEMAAVFYKKDVLSPIETGNFWLSETPDVPGSTSWKSSCTRMVTWARFRHIKADRFLFFFNTHFDHASEHARQESARVLLERIGALPSDATVIVTGDFNAAAEDSAPWRTLTAGGLADAWVTAGERIGPEVTFGGFRPPQMDRRERIDWVLTRGPIKSARCETVVYNQQGRYPSDHFPVVANLLWRE
jgi:endonuclease/exonuclease/phosphatase family metal-dependent hydrolase